LKDAQFRAIASLRSIRSKMLVLLFGVQPWLVLQPPDLGFAVARAADAKIRNAQCSVGQLRAAKSGKWRTWMLLVLRTR
jgi:hypothetical protein